MVRGELLEMFGDKTHKGGMKPLLICILLLLLIYSSSYQWTNYIEKETFKEIDMFHKFKNDPRNKGQYIMDFDTGIWYDIDGLNPNIPPLTIKEMGIKNIYERIIKKEISK